MFSFSLLKNLDLLSVGIAIAASILLGFIIYSQNKKSITGKAFLVFTVVSSVWGLVNYLSYKFTNFQVTLWLLRLVLYFALWQAFSFFVLSYVFPEDDRKLPGWISKILLPVVALVSILVLTPLVFKGVTTVTANGVPAFSSGPGIALFGILALALVLVSIGQIAYRIIKTKKARRLLYRYFMLGTVLIFLLIFGFTFFLPSFFGNNLFIPFGALFTLPFAGFTAFSIWRHGFLNVKVFSTQVLVFFLVLVNFVEITLASSVFVLIFRIVVFIFTLALGLILIRSVQKEILAREQVQKLSKELAVANDALKKLDQAKSEFLSVASHQLRTPLTAIKGYASMLLEGDFGKMVDPQRANVKIIYESAERLAELVNDLLDLSHIESGRMEFDFTAVNLCETVQSVIEEVSPKAKSRGLMLFFDNVNRSCPEIRADKEKIRQVVMNLIDNALKYTVKGGVTVQLHQVGDQLQFAVKDTGIGVDPKEKEKLFEKFFRTTAANELTREGTGLGIYVVKKIVESHGGKIWFESPGVNQGTTFYVTLPVPKGEIKEERVQIDSLEAF